MVGTISIAGLVVVGALAVVGSAYVAVATDDGSGTENRWSDWSIVAAVTLFVVALLWSVLTLS
jgi:cytochrome bd-type quinol oxidase subunit 2